MPAARLKQTGKPCVGHPCIRGTVDTHKIWNHLRKTKELLEFTMRWQHMGKGSVYVNMEQKFLLVKVKVKVKMVKLSLFTP